MPIAVNSSGDALYLTPDGTWAPTHVASDAKGNKIAFDGNSWVPLGGKPSVASDVVQSIGTGLRDVSNIAGLPGDVGNLMRRAFGMKPVHTGLLPTSQGIQGAEDKALGPAYQPQTTAGQYARTITDFLPAALGPGGAALKAADVLVPALTSETAGQVTQGTPYEPYARAIGALGGIAAPSVASRAISPLTVPAANKGAISALASEGVTPTAGQATGNKALQYLESGPTGGNAATVATKQGESFTSAVLGRAGINEPRATPEVIDKAYDDIGGQFDAVAANQNITSRPILNTLSSDAKAVEAKYLNETPPAMQAKVVSNLAQDIVDMAGSRSAPAQITGEKYQAWRSTIDRVARESGRDSKLAGALYDLKGALDDAFERSMAASGNTAGVAAWADARNKYRNLIVITKAAKNAADGIITPQAIRTAASSGRNLTSYVRGKSDFTSLANAGVSLLKPLPQSGTTPRALSYAIPGLIGSTIGAAQGNDKKSTLAGALLGLALPYAVGRGVISRPVQGYLSNQLAPRPPLSGSRVPLSLYLSQSQNGGQ